MKISKKTRYGCRFMITLAQLNESETISLRKVAEQEDISLKYLEQIVPPLKTKQIISSVRGAEGGYNLSKRPSEITMLEIIEALDGPIDLIVCEGDALNCIITDKCRMRPFWATFSQKMRDFLEGITLEQLME